jgi:hypothetical protein
MSGRFPIRWVVGRFGAACCGEPVRRSTSRAPAGVSGLNPFARRTPWTHARAPTTTGKALDVPLNRSMYQRSRSL